MTGTITTNIGSQTANDCASRAARRSSVNQRPLPALYAPPLFIVQHNLYMPSLRLATHSHIEARHVLTAYLVRQPLEDRGQNVRAHQPFEIRGRR